MNVGGPNFNPFSRHLPVERQQSSGLSPEERIAFEAMYGDNISEEQRRKLFKNWFGSHFEA